MRIGPGAPSFFLEDPLEEPGAARYGVIDEVDGVTVRRVMSQEEAAATGWGLPGDVLPGAEDVVEDARFAARESRGVRGILPGSNIVTEAERLRVRRGELVFVPSRALSSPWPRTGRGSCGTPRRRPPPGSPPTARRDRALGFGDSGGMRARTTPYVALLRGINVGGKNVIPMAALRACFEAHGYASVATYIQSGNVLFEAPTRDPAKLARAIEAALSADFGCDSRVVVRSHAEMPETVARAPKGFGAKPDELRDDVLFLMEPLSAEKALGVLPVKEGVDRVWACPGATCYSRRIARVAESRLARVTALPIYQSMTIRNWNTTTKLLALLDARARAPGARGRGRGPSIRRYSGVRRRRRCSTPRRSAALPRHERGSARGA